MLGDAGKAEYEIMQTAWRERNPVVRIKAAHSALEMNAECGKNFFRRPFLCDICIQGKIVIFVARNREKSLCRCYTSSSYPSPSLD